MINKQLRDGAAALMKTGYRKDMGPWKYLRYPWQEKDGWGCFYWIEKGRVHDFAIDDYGGHGEDCTDEVLDFLETNSPTGKRPKW